VETKLIKVNLTAWVHKECHITDEDALPRLQGAWDNPQQKEECSVVWMIRSGTTGWALTSDSWEDMGFKERFLAWMGRAKMARWGQGAVNSRGKRQTSVHESAEKRETRVRTSRSWGE
jgi:hypothetical protein